MFVFAHRKKQGLTLDSGVENEGWHRADIIAAVRKRGSTLAALGRSIGLAPKSMHWALGKRHPRANLAIAAFIGVDPHEIWPRFFLPTEKPSGAQPTPALPPMSPSTNRAA